MEVLILQHPLEVGASKGTGRLLHLCLSNSVLLTGERFDEGELRAALHAGGRSPVLLYPGGDALAGLAPAGQRLVVLDATWRKSRKMLHLNPLLAALPRASLNAVESGYRIRKAQLPDQLSTFEAAAHALAATGADAAPLFDVFDAFIEREAATIAHFAARA